MNKYFILIVLITSQALTLESHELESTDYSGNSELLERAQSIDNSRNAIYIAAEEVLDQRGITIGMSDSELIKRLEYGSIDWGGGAGTLNKALCKKRLRIEDSTELNCTIFSFPVALYPKGCFTLVKNNMHTPNCEGLVLLKNGWLWFYSRDNKIVAIDINYEEQIYPK